MPDLGPITRFELSFCGERQYVGFLDGICNIDPEDSSLLNMLLLFEDLPAPKLDPKERPSFWFTEKGLNTFQKEIEEIETTVFFHGWEVVTATIDGNSLQEDDVLYQDPYQVAIKDHTIDRIAPSFAPTLNHPF